MQRYVDSRATGAAEWLRNRVFKVRDDGVAVVLSGVEHIITRDQAIALGARLLEAGIGTTFHEERFINAQIGDLVCQARKTLQHG